MKTAIPFSDPPSPPVLSAHRVLPPRSMSPFFRNAMGAIFLLLLTVPVGADVALPAIFSNHMVLQRSAKVPIWGRADPGESVRVSLGDVSSKTRADPSGKWKVEMDLSGVPGPGPFEFVVKGNNELKIQDVLIGEVWLGSGQSNMEMTVKKTANAREDIARSANPMLREFAVRKAFSRNPAESFRGEWVAASPQTTGNFSATGYFFANKLQSELKVPVGVINASWGGTPSESWTSAEALDRVPDLKSACGRIWAAADMYPEQKKTFVERLQAWTAKHGRGDKASADPSVFAGEGISTEGWVSVTLPGPVKASGLPEAGVIWLRKEIDFPSKPLADVLPQLPIDGFDAVYWNGNLVKAMTVEDYPGTGYVRRYGPYTIPPEKVHEGKNVLAIRLYEPVGPARFFAEPKVGPKSLAGPWMAKAEVEFFPVDSSARDAAPQPPVALSEPQNIPANLFNGMISPLIPYALRGVIWYQGESNGNRAWQYRAAFPLLISDWRKHWGQGDMPFYFCQLANYMEKRSRPVESGWAELREAQSLTLQLPNTGQAVLIDIGESGDVHPRNKKEVGDRLARIALARDYGRGALPYSGPVYDSMKVENGQIVLDFKHTVGGLVARPVPGTCDVRTLSHATQPLVRNSPDSPLEGFAICGEDKKWVWANARIEGDRVIVWSDAVPAPVAVRYAWADNPTCNLYNGAGLPASPFRTDDFPPTTLDGKF